MSCRLVITLGLACFLANSVYAQPQLGAPPRPAFSPYLNLVRPGASPALNYYGLVRPEIQARQSIQNLQGAVSTNQRALGSLEADLNSLPGTGHQTMFLNHQSYFMTNGAGSSAGRAGSSGQTFLSTGFNRGSSSGVGGGGRGAVPRR